MIRRYAATLLGVAPLLAGCGMTGLGEAAASLPTVRGAVGQTPKIEVPRGRPPAKPRVKILSEGSGPVVQPGQVVLTNAEVRVWQGNRTYLGTYDTKQPTTVVLDGRHVSRTWADALVGKKAGSRVLLVSPAMQGFGPSGVAPAGVSPTDTLIIVFDIIGGYAPTAQVTGAMAANEARLPRVTVEPGRPPRMVFPAGLPAPDRLMARTLVAGSGPEVRAGSTVVVQFTNATWGAKKSFDSSYERGGPNAFILGNRSALPGWLEGLIGQRVGSRVLLVVPKQATRGFTMTTGGMAVPPGKATVAVIDILDAR